MNREEAKQFLPLIQAFAEGKELQIQTIKSKWGDLIGEPLFNVSPENYRIKPEKKTGWIAVYRAGGVTGLFNSKTELIKYMHSTYGDISNLQAILQITYEEGEGL